MADLDRLIMELIERPKVFVDHVPYELKAPGELTVLDHYRMAVLGAQFTKLSAKDDLELEEQEDLRQALISRSELILEHLPQKVCDLLSDAQRVALIEVFTKLSPFGKIRKTVEAVKNLIGVSLCRACSASMAAPPIGG